MIRRAFHHTTDRTRTMLYRRAFLVATTFLLVGCAVYQPRIGMTYDEWRRSVDWKEVQNIKIVAAKEGMQVWTLDDGVFLYFENGRLVKVDQGELMQRRYQIEIRR